MLQADVPDTYVLATGRTETVRDFLILAFAAAGIEVAMEGTGVDERAVCTATGKTVMRINPLFNRPAEVDLLIGSAAKAKAELGWEAKTSLEELCRLMVEADLRRNADSRSF